MAVNDPLNPTGQSNAQINLNQQGGQQGAQTFAGGPSNPLDFMDLLGSGSALIAPRSNGEVLAKVATALTETIKRNYGGTMPKDWFIITLDHTTNGGPASIVSVAAMRRGTNGNMVFVTNLILEAAKVNLAPTTQTYQNRTLQITTTLGQVFDNECWETVRRRIADQLGVEAKIVTEVSTIIMPKDYDLENADSLTRLAYLSTVASAIAANGGTGIKMNLADVTKDPKQQFVTRCDFTGHQKQDMLGRPVRADLVVGSYLTTSSGQNSSYKNEQQLVELAAFVELNYAGPLPVAQQPGLNPVMGTQIYAPEIVITNTSSVFFDFDIARALFCLVNAGALEKGGVWARAFLPRPGANKKGSINLRDIGGIGYELEAAGGKAIQTGRDVFTTEDLGQLLMTYFHQSPAISLDIDINGPMNWVMNEFLQAGLGDSGAQQRIIAAANQMTNNAFTRHYQGNGQIAQVRHLIAAGTYVNEDNEVRSLDDIDYLAALNLFGSIDKSAFQAWAKTFEDPNMGDMERLSERENLLRSRLSGVEIHAYKRRVTFDKKFLAALEAAFVECGYRPAPDNVAPVFGNQVVRGNQNILNLAAGNFGNALFAGNQQVARGGSVLGGRITSYGN